jgi:hypothetical protein
MSEINPKLASAEGAWDMDAVGGACLADMPFDRGPMVGAAPVLPPPLQFARSIEALSPRLVERFRLCGINPPGAEAMAREFTRKLATVFYALDIQPGAPDTAWALSKTYRKDAPLPYTMALHALLPDMVRLCAGGWVGAPLWSTPGSEGAVPTGQGRRRLLVLAALVGCLTRAEDASEGPLTAAETLAQSLVRWARREMAERTAQAGVGSSRRVEN